MIKTLLLLLSAGKLGKVALSGGSMLLSLGAYALLYGWRYAVGFVAMLLVHELGHYMAARKIGMAVGLPMFIPFVGAWVALKEQPMDAETEAYIGIAGPMLGTSAAFACYLYAEHSGQAIFLAIAYAGFMLNLINLIPILPMDGGRIMAAISPKLWVLGVPLLVGLFIWQPSPMILIIGLIAMPQVWSVVKNWHNEGAAYYQVSPAVRWSYSAQYLMLVLALLFLSYEAHEAISLH